MDVATGATESEGNGSDADQRDDVMVTMLTGLCC